MSDINNRPGVVVRATDVLVLTVPERLSPDAKQKYLDWFRKSIAGTSLEACKIILLDGGVQVEVYRGDSLEMTMP